MLGIILLFIGGVLLINGVGALGLVERKSAAVMNFLTGSLVLLINLVLLFRARETGEFYVVATGFLFVFTYYYAAISTWFELDMRGFGWYCLFVAVTTVPCSMVAFESGDPRIGIFWLIWGMLWLLFFIAYGIGKDLGRFLPFATIAIGVLTCWIPGFLMLVGRW